MENSPSPDLLRLRGGKERQEEEARRGKKDALFGSWRSQKKTVFTAGEEDTVERSVQSPSCVGDSIPDTIFFYFGCWNRNNKWWMELARKMNS